METVKEVPFEYNSQKYVVKVSTDDKNYYAQVCNEDGTEAYKNEFRISIENDQKFQEKHSKTGIDQIVENTKSDFIDYLNTDPSDLH